MDRNQQILASLRKQLEGRFPGIIDKIVLFGSQVEPGNHEDSDYDILVIIDMERTWGVEQEILDLCYDIDLEYDIVTDVKVLSRSELGTIKGKQEFVLDAFEKGLAA